jgi:hypothetical protein
MPNRFRLDDFSVRRLLHDPLGEVGRLMGELGDKVFQVARETVPVRTGETRNSIDLDVHPGPDDRRVQEARVSASYAVMFLEKGTVPHWIVRHAFIEGNEHSSLMSDERQFFGPVVWHPGITRRPFLTTGLWSIQNDV